MELNEQLKKYRKQEGLTQKDLALRLNVSDKTISSWETGRTYPDISLLINLSSILKISLDEFLKGDSETVEKIDKDLKLKKVYKLWLFVILSVLVLIGGSYVFFSNYQYQNESIDRFNPLMSTKIGYAAIPTEKTAIESDYSNVLRDSKIKKYIKALGMPFKNMVVTDDAWGNSLFLTFQGGLAPNNKPFAMVEHRGLYVSRINFVDWESIPNSIRNNMYEDYADYRGMYEEYQDSKKNLPKGIRDNSNIFIMHNYKY